MNDRPRTAVARSPAASSTPAAPAPDNRTPQEKKLALINGRLGRLSEHLQAVLPRFITPERMIRVTLLAINRQPKLLNCTAESIAEAMMTIASWGLEIGRTAHLVPYGDKAQAQADYKGMIELAIRGDSITSCRARVVHAKDQFEVEYGLVERLYHVPTWRDDPGDPIGVYAVVGLPSGEVKFDLLSAAEVALVKRRSKAANDGPWVTDPEEMWKKTVVKRLLKMVPQNPMLAEALELDENERAATAAAVRGATITDSIGAARTHRGVRDGGYETRGQQMLAAPDGAIEVTQVAADAQPAGAAVPAEVVDMSQKPKVTAPADAATAPYGAEQGDAHEPEVAPDAAAAQAARSYPVVHEGDTVREMTPEEMEAYDQQLDLRLQAEEERLGI